ncbi:MAG: hypothetical protein AB7G11_13295 [Phycisphaerales bacterium]
MNVPWIRFLVGGVVLALAGLAKAQCGYIDFENLPAGTSVSTQYPGITFSGRNTNGTAAANPIIQTIGNNTSSPTRALRAFGDGLNEFSCDFLRMEFDSAQHLVTFSLGRTVGCGDTDTCRVRWYNAAGALLGSRDVLVSGAPGVARCNTAVRVGTVAGPSNITRIDVEYGVNPLCGCAFELLDDIVYDTDTTPPVGTIVAPAPLACICAGSNQIRGAAFDPDGTYTGDRLEFADAPAGPWTLIGSATVPAPGPNDILYSWDSTGLSSGYYWLRLTVNNSCGLDTEFVSAVFVDNSPPSINLRAPGVNQIVGGTACFDGSVTDSCGLNPGYTVSYRPAAGGAFNPVQPAMPTYPTQVINDPLASWNTSSGGAAVVDGTYTVRVAATDTCGLSNAVMRNIVVDNTPPIAVITDPVGCSRVARGLVTFRGTAADANIAGWVLQYTGGDAHGWVTIASGNSNVDGVLAVWDARTLRECCYVVRLVVTDAANVNCTGNGNRSEYTVAFDLGSTCTQDYNGDGFVNSQDFFDFITIFFGGCP